MTQNLDEQWKALSTLMGIKERKDKEAKTTSDDYDKLVNSLRFETKTSVKVKHFLFFIKEKRSLIFRVYQSNRWKKDKKKKKND